MCVALFMDQYSFTDALQDITMSLGFYCSLGVVAASLSQPQSARSPRVKEKEK